MDGYLDLNRSFAAITEYSPQTLLGATRWGRHASWNTILQSRFSVVVARANFGKTMEFKAKSLSLRAEGKAAVFVPLHRVLGDATLDDAFDAEDLQALASWRLVGGKLTVFIDSLDEAGLAAEDGIRRALRRLMRGLDWPNPAISLVLSSRPAVLTDAVLELLQVELSAKLFVPSKKSGDDTDFEDIFDTTADEDEHPPGSTAAAQPEGLDAGSTTAVLSEPPQTLRLFALRPLDSAGAIKYLKEARGINHATETLAAARRYGLVRFAEGPGGLDILAYVDPANRPPQSLTDAYQRAVDAISQQQRVDPRERRIGNPSPQSLDKSIELLASASMVCRLQNIEISSKALNYREGVLAARVIVGHLVSDDSLAYLLGSRLFIDAGHHQVKLYPDELLPFLAAKRLASLVHSPEDAGRLLANFIWRSTTGECGVQRYWLPLVGWLSAFSSHCRQVLLDVEPQAVAFFGDLRRLDVSMSDATKAIERTVARLLDGDSIGRTVYTLTAENYWQAAKPGLEPVLKRLMSVHGDDFAVRDALLNVAANADLDIFRDEILAKHGGHYSKLLAEHLDLYYILALGRQDDLKGLAAAFIADPTRPGTDAPRLVAELAWKTLDAKSIAAIATARMNRRDGVGFSLEWILTREVGPSAPPEKLHDLSRSLLLKLIRRKDRHNGGESYWAGEKLLEIVTALIALTVKRKAVRTKRAVWLCLVLARHIERKHMGGSDLQPLRSALAGDKELRLEYLRARFALLAPAGDAFNAAYSDSRLYSYVEGDEVELGRPDFDALVASTKAAEARAKAKAPVPARRRRLLKVEEASKAKLEASLNGLRDGSDLDGLALAAALLVETIVPVRYGECRFEEFGDAAGAEIADAVRSGLSKHWRQCEPVWEEAEPHSLYNVTIAGLQGLHLDLGDGAQLPTMTDDEVRRAIRYAPFEVNGYPRWFWPLITQRQRVASEGLAAMLDQANRGPLSVDKAEALLRHLDKAPPSVQARLVSAVWRFVSQGFRLSEHTLRTALSRIGTTGAINANQLATEASKNIFHAFDEELPVLTDTKPSEPLEETRAREALTHRFKELTQLRSNAAAWAGAWLLSSPGTFVARFTDWWQSHPAQARQCLFALAADFGEQRGIQLKELALSGNAGLEALRCLYAWIHEVVKQEDVIDRRGKGAYSLRARDYAQRMREAMVPAILAAKTEKAYEVLDDLRKAATGSEAKYLRHTQIMMREDQLATSPVRQDDYFQFEQTFAPPVSSFKQFALAIETDLMAVKAQIEHGEFSLRRFFSTIKFERIKTDKDGLALEADFQALLGSELNHAAGGRYSVMLEPELPEGTRRDILCQTSSFRASVELKMSERWTFDHYVEALDKQLHRQYLRAPDSKIGFLVIVLQRNRPWFLPDGSEVDFSGLLAILRAKAREKEVGDGDLFLRVIGIDAVAPEDFRAKKVEQADGLSNPQLAQTSGGSVVAKYVSPSGLTWSGRGRMPTWMKDAIAAGATREDFLIPPPPTTS
ncbi:H-NS family nucleoid-associated regulatory protein [Pelomonas parva]|uniref:H-NS family nucleoid-associated regulatory protein n=1 Tax=Pelomonas parva TaxID=3299032 RepID=A0ABW7F107_9BURK